MKGIERAVENREQGGGVLKEILKTPVFKDILRDYLGNIDPQNGRSMAKTFLWEDTEVILAIMGALPSMINWFIGFLGEMGKQINSAFTPQLLKAFIENMGADVDKDGFKEGLSAFVALVQGILKEYPGLEDAILKAIGEGVNVSTRRVNRIYRQDPARIGNIISGVLSHVDNREFSEAITNLTNTILDQRPPVVSWGARLMGARIWGKFRKRG